MKTFDLRVLTWLPSLALAALSLPACGDGETCSGDDCAQGGAGAATTAGSGGGDQGGAGGNPLLPTVRVLDRNDVPGAAFDVLLHDESGTLVAHEKTNAAGEITAAVPAGGSVSVLYVDDFIQDATQKSRSVVLTVDVAEPAPQPMIVRFERTPSEVMAAGTTTLAISFPPLPAATKYTFTSTCKRDPMYLTTTNVEYTDVPICTADGKYDLLVVAYDAANAIVDYASVTGQSFVEGGTSEPAIAWEGAQFAMASLGIVNVPNGALNASVQTGSSRPSGARLLFISTSMSLPSPGATVEQDLPHVASYGDSHCQNVSLFVSSDPSGAFATAQASRCSPSFDASPFIWDASRLDRPTLQPVEAMLPLRLDWDVAGTGEAGDVIVTEASWGDDDARSIWLAFHATEDLDAVFPELPAELGAYAPQPGDVIDALVARRDYADMNGYVELLAGGSVWADQEQQASFSAPVTVLP